jgi:glycosyltransferase involved in cell wall biosynthesis
MSHKYNLEILVICYSSKEKVAYQNFILNSKIKVYRLPYLFKFYSTPLHVTLFNRFAKIIDEEHPDLVNAHMPVPLMADIACRVSLKRKIPFVLTYHNDVVGQDPLSRLLAQAYYAILGFGTLSKADKIVVTSEYYALTSRYLSRYKPKIVVIPPGVDFTKFRPRRTNYIREKYNIYGNIVLFVGRLDKRARYKGLDYLIKAMKRVCAFINDVWLVVVGAGNALDDYKMIVRKEGLQQRVIFAGHIDDEELPLFYSGSDLFVLPSYGRAEGFGIVLLEAQACCTTVIGTKAGGIPYLIRHGKTGLLVSPKNAEALSSAILRVLSDQSLRAKLSQSAYNYVTTKFSWERVAEKTMETFRECVI